MSPGVSSAGSEPNMVDISESFHIFQLVCSGSFEKEMRKKRRSSTRYQGRQKHDTRNECCLFLPVENS
jgi:hypothetical protein